MELFLSSQLCKSAEIKIQVSSANYHVKSLFAHRSSEITSAIAFVSFMMWKYVQFCWCYLSMDEHLSTR